MNEGSPTGRPVKPCPICGKPAAPRHAPFCSARCATIDLARWLKGDYRVPTGDAPEDGPPPEEREE